MVDFSDRTDIKRWLDTIEPVTRRREVAVALAARAAPRVLPVLSSALDVRARERDRRLSNFILPVFRATAVPWAGGKYPAHGKELAATATTAAASVAYAAGATATVLYAAVAAYRAANAADDDADTTDTTDATARAAAIGSGRSRAELAAAVAFRIATASDAAAIDSGRSGAELAGAPLWPSGAPDSAAENWRRLKAALLQADQGWEVWTDWYEARLAGDAARPPIEALEVARATIANEIWEQGPAAVNAEIERLIEEHQNLRQRPAAFQFAVDDAGPSRAPKRAKPKPRKRRKK